MAERTTPGPVATRVVAVEEHFVSDGYFKRVSDLAVFPGEEPERKFVANFPKNREMLRRFTDMDVRLGEMDAAGVDVSVLSLNPPGVQIFSDADVATGMAVEANDQLAAMISANPSRFHGLAAVAPQDPERAAREAKRAVGTLGLGGVLIGSHTGGHYLDEPQFEPLLSALEEEDATLYLHPRSPSPQMIGPFLDYGMVAALWGFQAEANTHAMRLIASGTLDRHPRLKVVLGHLGEALPFWLWRLDNIYEKTFAWAGDALGMVKLDLTPTEYLRRNFSITTSGMTDPAALRFCIERLGAERIMFAIDYPYEDSEVAVGLLTSADLSERELALIGHENAERLFRVPEA